MQNTTKVVRVREADEQAVLEMAKQQGWTGTFPELLNRYHAHLREQSKRKADRPSPRRTAST